MLGDTIAHGFRESGGVLFRPFRIAECVKALLPVCRIQIVAHPEFEIVFVSNDKSAGAMENYMRDDQMPWPALSFDKVSGNVALNKYAGSGIPCLVVVDENGKVVFDTYAGKNYRGPEAVLTDLDQLFAGKTGGQVAQVR